MSTITGWGAGGGAVDFDIYITVYAIKQCFHFVCKQKDCTCDPVSIACLLSIEGPHGNVKVCKGRDKKPEISFAWSNKLMMTLS